MRESNLKVTNLQTYADKQNQIVKFNWLIGKIWAVSCLVLGRCCIRRKINLHLLNCVRIYLIIIENIAPLYKSVTHTVVLDIYTYPLFLQIA